MSNIIATHIFKFNPELTDDQRKMFMYACEVAILAGHYEEACEIAETFDAIAAKSEDGDEKQIFEAISKMFQARSDYLSEQLSNFADETKLMPEEPSDEEE